jgi:hypothetical protein
VPQFAFSKSSNALAEELPMRIGDHRIQWAAMRQAEVILDNAVPGTSAVEWRNRIYALAEGLFQSIHMQLSVAKYKAIAVERGATLDSLDTPLNNRSGWRRGSRRFARCRTRRTAWPR